MPEEDLLFAKNRHFFGGLAPSNMRQFNAYIDKTAKKVRIDAQLPFDTIINNQTLCTVAGAIIRRKTTSFPIDEFDGDLVATINQDISFIDEDTDSAGVYFYSAFPFTTQGVYNRNKVNRVNIGAPDSVISFRAESNYKPITGETSINLFFELPNNADGALIRKSTVEYPIMEYDGDFVTSVTSSGNYIDTEVSPDITYFYTIFPFRGVDLYNYDESNRLTITVHRYNYYYGFDLDISNPVPSERVSYPVDVDNHGYAPAKMVLGNNAYFDYGSWPNTAGNRILPRPCVLGFDGRVEFYLDSNDYSKKIDGTYSYIASTRLQGEVMMEWPKIYTKRWEENGIYHFRCSDVKIDSGYECWTNYDNNNNEIDHFYTSVFPVSYPGYYEPPVDGKDPQNVDWTRLKSISNHYPTRESSEISQSILDKIRMDKTDPLTWNIELLADRLLINDLLIMMAKTTDLGGAYGYVSEINSNDYTTGKLNKKGLFYHQNCSKVFGMEAWYNNDDGNLLAGWYYDNGTQKIKITPGTKDGSKASDFDLNGTTGYISVSNSGIIGSFYLTNCIILPFGRLPKTLNGSSTTFEASRVNYSKSGKYRAIVGAESPFDINLYHNAGLYYIFMSCKPLATS